MKPLSIVFIGAGNVAFHLSQALSRQGFLVRQVFSRSEAPAKELSERLGCSYTTDLKEVSAQADVYIVAVKDSVLTEVLPQVTKHNSKALFVHTAGSISMNIWEGLAERYGVIYPMQTFSKKQPLDFGNVPFFIEARYREDKDLLLKIARSLSPKVYEASSEQRRYLHIGAVFACNFTNHLYAVCQHLLENNGLPFEAMFPLIDETAQKVHRLSPTAAQTGPAQRNDTNVMNRHIEMLKNEPELARIYELLSKNIQQYNKQDDKI